ncbi:hypothetical protein D3C74_476100 [compost metagenome]
MGDGAAPVPLRQALLLQGSPMRQIVSFNQALHLRIILLLMQDSLQGKPWLLRQLHGRVSDA